MKKLCLLLALSLPAVALAQGEAPPQLDAKAEKHMRAARTLMLVDALELDVGQAQQLDNGMATYDARKKPLMEKMHAAHEQLQKIAKDGGQASQVDALVNELGDLESQLHKIDHEMYLELSKNMTEQQKARFAPMAMHAMPPPHGDHQGPPHGAPGEAPPPLEAQ